MPPPEKRSRADGTRKKPYVPPAVSSGDMNFARAAHCGQCDEGLTGVAFTEIHPSSCDAGQEPMSNS